MTKANKDKLKKQFVDAKGKRQDIALLLPTKWKKKLTSTIIQKE